MTERSLDDDDDDDDIFGSCSFPNSRLIDIARHISHFLFFFILFLSILWCVLLTKLKTSNTNAGKPLRGCIQKFPDQFDNEIKSNKHSLRSNTKGYGCKTD
jgi:hypothetical protein